MGVRGEHGWFSGALSCECEPADEPNCQSSEEACGRVYECGQERHQSRSDHEHQLIGHRLKSEGRLQVFGVIEKVLPSGPNS